jgi:hypothetical protein
MELATVWHVAMRLPDAWSSNPYFFGRMRIGIQVRYYSCLMRVASDVGEQRHPSGPPRPAEL